METVILFDPSIRSFNMGDHIIMESSELELKKILKNKFVIKAATHTPVMTFYQNTNHNPRIKVYDNAQAKFICGSNLLWRNLFVPDPSLNINLLNSRAYNGSVLLGVGTHHKSKKLNLYTKKLYRKILSKKLVHSVRDEDAKALVESLGLKAVNTGCPTMWKFTKEFCKQIPKVKSDSVVFTITDYNIDLQNDQIMIDLLVKNYKKVYFWVQGIEDYEHFKSFKNTQNIEIIPPVVGKYKKILEKEEIDYVGTRLHAGIYAMQHKCRTIILSIDNRVESMKKSYGINSIKREFVQDQLEQYILSEFNTEVNINESAIKKWRAQFEVVKSE